jgi:hypothetical protein
VHTAFDLTRLNDFRIDWLVHRHLIRHRDDTATLADAVDAVVAEGVAVESAPLRQLDVLLWTATKMAPRR